MQELKKSQPPTQQEVINLEQIKRNLSDEGAERALLACLMKAPSKMVDCSAVLSAKDFTNENNAYLYDIMLNLFKKTGGKNCSFDIATMQMLAREKGAEDRFLQRSGGEEYIGFLNIVKESWVDVASFQIYVDKVASLSIRRKLIDGQKEFTDKILNLDNTPEELMVKEQTALNELLITSSNNSGEILKLAAKTVTVLEDALEQKKQIIGLRTSFPKLDSTIEGLRRGNLIIVSAPRKTGKSAFLMNIGINTAIKQKIPTLMISTEMSDSEIMFRTLSNVSLVPEKQIIKGNLSQSELEAVLKAERQLADSPFYHVEMRGFTLEKIIATVRKFVSNNVGFREDGKAKDCLVIFDYIKMPQSANAKDLKEYKVLGMIADGMKILAGDLDIPFLTACQTNRAGDVANSYELTWFCNTFMELRKKTQQEIDRDNASGVYYGNQLLKIIANRGGEENHEGIPFDYTGETIRYVELSNVKSPGQIAREAARPGFGKSVVM